MKGKAMLRGLALTFLISLGLMDSACCTLSNTLANKQTGAADMTIQENTGILLGAPTDSSIVIKIRAGQAMEGYLAYGPGPQDLNGQSDNKTYNAGDVQETTLTGLKPDLQYYYQLYYRGPGTSDYTAGVQGSFHTGRSAGQGFVFTVQADSHRDEQSNLNLYQRALQNVLQDKPDFHIDLGDTFMAEKMAKTKSETSARYLQDRAYFEQIGSSVPLFLVNGNHEGENGWIRQKGSDNVALWASEDRLKYFVNPRPGSFYSGSLPGQGNYYAFQWGDALFITLDPFWFSQKKAQNDSDGWSYTLGKTQYDWLKTTLESSSAKYKFVFLHNLVGGKTKDARGGVEAARYFEWGGCNADGVYAFDKMRPGWDKPIHQLLKDTNVTAVFHGHDHFYDRQELDGIIYQLAPQPSHPGQEVKQASAYGYNSGVILPPAGHIRVSVSNQNVRVDYVSASLSDMRNGQIAYSYVIEKANN